MRYFEFTSENGKVFFGCDGHYHDGKHVIRWIGWHETYLYIMKGKDNFIEISKEEYDVALVIQS